MPCARLKRCGFRGCPRTTRNRFCDEHLPLAPHVWDRKRGSTTESGYDADFSWMKLSLYVSLRVTNVG